MTDADRTKFALAMIALVAATGMLLLGRITGDAWVTAMTWIVAAYMLGQPAAVLASGWTVAKNQVSVQSRPKTVQSGQESEAR